LKCTRCLTGSQWSCFKTDVMCSCRRTRVIRRAAAFWTACTRRNKLSVMPYRSELQWSRRLEINVWTRVLVASVDNDLTTGRNCRSRKKPERQTALTCMLYVPATSWCAMASNKSLPLAVVSIGRVSKQMIIYPRSTFTHDFPYFR